MGQAPYRFRVTIKGHSRILFARPSFIEGVARIFDLGGTLSEYNICDTGEQADYWALWSDWHAIGNDIREAAGNVMSGTANK